VLQPALADAAAGDARLYVYVLPHTSAHMSTWSTHKSCRHILCANVLLHQRTKHNLACQVFPRTHEHTCRRVPSVIDCYDTSKETTLSHFLSPTQNV
jgi:hypothetical protein